VSTPLYLPWLPWTVALSPGFVLFDCVYAGVETKVAGDNGISETKSKQQSPCSNCMHQPVTSCGNACSTCMYKPVRCMHQPVMSQVNPCTYCMGSVVLISSRIYLISSYFGGNNKYVPLQLVMAIWGDRIFLLHHSVKSPNLHCLCICLYPLEH
jgi:hypothetical protein